MGILIVAILLGLIPAMVAQSKGRSFVPWWIYGSLLFLIALPHALLLKPEIKQVEHQQAAQGLKKCPFCAEMIKPDATVCRYCGRDLPEASPSLRQAMSGPSRGVDIPWDDPSGGSGATPTKASLPVSPPPLSGRSTASVVDVAAAPDLPTATSTWVRPPWEEARPSTLRENPLDVASERTSSPPPEAAETASASTNRSMKKCLFCGEQIRDEAIKCRYCGSNLSAAHVTSVPDTTPSADPVRQDAERLLKAGKKIQAIKFVREHKHVGLKESKDYVEALQETKAPEQDGPAGSVPWDDPSGGCGAAQNHAPEGTCNGDVDNPGVASLKKALADGRITQRQFDRMRKNQEAWAGISKWHRITLISLGISSFVLLGLVVLLPAPRTGTDKTDTTRSETERIREGVAARTELCRRVVEGRYDARFGGHLYREAVDDIARCMNDPLHSPDGVAVERLVNADRGSK
jgi:ribosomal protein L32